MAERRVPSMRVVEALDVVEHVSPRIVPGAVDLAECALGLERGEEALHRRVLSHISGPGHRAGDAVVGHRRWNCAELILAAAIGVMQQSIKIAASSDRRDGRIGGQLDCHLRLYRPAHHPPGEQVGDGGNVQPALGDPVWVKSATHFWFGADAWKARSRICETIARSPLSLGKPRRRGHALSSLTRISRSMRCRSQR